MGILIQILAGLGTLTLLGGLFEGAFHLFSHFYDRNYLSPCTREFVRHAEGHCDPAFCPHPHNGQVAP